MNDIVQDCIDKFQEVKVKQNLLFSSLKDKESIIGKRNQQVENFIKGRWVLSEVAKLTQERFKDKVESLVTMAIQSVFDRSFRFELIFEQKRNKMECRFVISEIINGEKVEYDSIADDMGGGLVDIVGFALRIVLWSLEKPRSRSFMVLDEPFRFVGSALIEKAGVMLREISTRLGIQFIVVTHESELSEVGDRSWLVEHKEGISNVILLTGHSEERRPRLLRRRK